MTMTWTDWIPRERDDAPIKLEELRRFFGRVWFPEDPRTPIQPQRNEGSSTQHEIKPKEKD